MGRTESPRSCLGSHRGSVGDVGDVDPLQLRPFRLHRERVVHQFHALANPDIQPLETEIAKASGIELSAPNQPAVRCGIDQRDVVADRRVRRAARRRELTERAERVGRGWEFPAQRLAIALDHRGSGRKHMNGLFRSERLGDRSRGELHILNRDQALPCVRGLNRQGVVDGRDRLSHLHTTPLKTDVAEPTIVKLGPRDPTAVRGIVHSLSRRVRGRHGRLGCESATRDCLFFCRESRWIPARLRDRLVQCRGLAEIQVFEGDRPKIVLLRLEEKRVGRGGHSSADRHVRPLEAQVAEPAIVELRVANPACVGGSPDVEVIANGSLGLGRQGRVNSGSVRLEDQILETDVHRPPDSNPPPLEADPTPLNGRSKSVVIELGVQDEVRVHSTRIRLLAQCRCSRLELVLRDIEPSNRQATAEARLLSICIPTVAKPPPLNWL